MKYKITGMSKETGEDIVVVLEADSKESAEKTAYSMNMAVYTSKTIEVIEENIMPAKQAPRIVAHHDSPIQNASMSNPANSMPTLNVHVKSNSNSLGIASIVLGILAFLICWIPFIGTIGFLLGCLGGALAIIGLILSIKRAGAGIGYPIAGLALNGLSVGIAILVTGALVNAIDEVSSQVEARNAPPTLKPDSPKNNNAVKNTEIIFVTATDKGHRERNFQDFIWFDFTVNPTNLTKTARAVKGQFVFADVFDEVKLRLNYTIDDPLVAGRSTTLDGIGFNYNQFMSDHHWMKSTSLENMNIWFAVDSILYKDGSKEDF
jgi:hypothetical protein